jgi:hypothetical protein
MLAYQPQAIREGWFRVVIPGGHWPRDLAIRTQRQGQQGDEREEAHQHGSGPRHSVVRPWALGFHAERCAALFQADRNRPAHDDPLQDLPRGRLQVGAEARCQPPLPLWVTPPDNAEVDGGQAASVPQGGGGKDP